MSLTMDHSSTVLKCLALLALLSQLCASSSIDSVERELYEYLFTNYSSDIRPVGGSNYYEQLIVTVQFSIAQIEDLNEKDEQLISHGAVIMYWTDQLLTWNPADYNNAQYLIVPATKVWLPEVTAINSVLEADELAFQQSNIRVRIFNTGLVVWTPGIRWKTTCAVDISAFPYDEQNCSILYANFVYTSALVNFSLVEEVIITNLTEASAWQLVEATATYSEFADEYYTYPMIQLGLKLKRSSGYFELNIILPAILLSFLLIPMFILPVDSGEKVSLGVTLMLAYSIFLLMLSDYTPQSGSVPKLSVVLVVCIIFSGVGMFTNVLIINIHHHMPDKAVPKWLKKLLLEVIGTVICRMKYADEQDASKVEPLFINSGKTGDVNKTQLEKKLPPSSELEQILAYLEFFKTKRLDDEQVEQNKEDWNKVARVLDRIFLILYVIFFVVYLFVTLSYRWRAN